MGTVRKEMSERSLETAVKWLLVVVVVTTAAIVTYYVNDRYRHPNVPLVDREMQRLEEMVRRDPGNAEARVAAADTYVAKKMYDQAIVQYAEALKLNEKNQGALLGLGLAYMRKGDTAKMVEYFDRLIPMNEGKDWSQVDRRLQVVYYNLGRVYVQRGEFDLAIERLKGALIIDRTDADSLYLLGNAYLGKGQYEDAVAAFRKAVAFVPNFVEAYQGMAQGFEKLGERPRAAYPRAMVIFFGGDKAGALRQLEQVAVQVTDDAELFWALGMMREDADQKESAAEAYRKALALNDKHALARDGLNRVEGN